MEPPLFPAVLGEPVLHMRFLPTDRCYTYCCSKIPMQLRLGWHNIQLPCVAAGGVCRSLGGGEAVKCRLLQSYWPVQLQHQHTDTTPIHPSVCAQAGLKHTPSAVLRSSRCDCIYLKGILFFYYSFQVVLFLIYC